MIVKLALPQQDAAGLVARLLSSEQIAGKWQELHMWCSDNGFKMKLSTKEGEPHFLSLSVGPGQGRVRTAVVACPHFQHLAEEILEEEALAGNRDRLRQRNSAETHKSFKGEVRVHVSRRRRAKSVRAVLNVVGRVSQEHGCVVKDVYETTQQDSCGTVIVVRSEREFIGEREAELWSQVLKQLLLAAIGSEWGLSLNVNTVCEEEEIPF